MRLLGFVPRRVIEHGKGRLGVLVKPVHFGWMRSHDFVGFSAGPEADLRLAANNSSVTSSIAFVLE